MLFCESYAQKVDTVYVGIYVRDSFSRETLEATVTVMDSDSTVLDIPKCGKRHDDYYFLAILPRRERYIIKAECKGHESGYGEVRLRKGEYEKFADDILLKRSAIELDEVTVLGSKVMMVNRGDTIVYNASAFQLSSGSMLDALIRQLPGAELRRGGQIYVNGKFVRELLVNGRDFFKGDPKIALENLPAYYVENIKVYHKASDMMRAFYGDSIKANELEDPYVMDVRLKRDYAEGWLANAEAGYGTDDRWLARLFAMRYTNHSGLFLFGNMNNLNNEQSAEKSGEWAGKQADEGILKVRTAGINFTGDDKISRTAYRTSAKIQTTDGGYENISSADNFYATGNVYDRSRQQRTQKQTTLEWKGGITYPNRKLYCFFTPEATYTKTENHSLLRAASFGTNPQDSYRGAAIDSLYSPLGSHRLTDLLISRREQLTQGTTEQYHLAGGASVSVPVSGNFIQLSLDGIYRQTNHTGWSLEHLGYGPTSGRDDEQLNKYDSQPNKSYRYSIDLNTYLLRKMVNRQMHQVRLYYTYSQHFSSGDRQLYRLDRYERYRDGIGMLPSTTDSLQSVTDLRNSYHTTTLGRENMLRLNVLWNQLQVDLPLKLVNDQLNDHRNQQRSQVRRQRLRFDPSVRYRWKDIQFTYDMRTQLPDLTHLLDVRDDSDPLFVSLGNAKLKTVFYHVLKAAYRKQQTERQRSISFEHSVDLIQRAVSIGRSYDLKTGVTTTRPENIDGNWSTWGTIGWSQQVDKARHLLLTTSTHYSYQHNVDYATLSATALTSEKSTVHNLTLGETVKGEYRLRDWYVAATGHATWRHTVSPNETFATINAVDFHYGLMLIKPFLKHFDVNTEMMMWSRRGYSDPTMNDDELIWNISLGYAFGRLKQWILKAEGRDVLRCQNSVRHTMNAQGRTETWYKTLPSYWMLRLQYQFKKEPKKRKKYD